MKKGSVRVERMDDGVTVPIGKMSAGSMFGEMSVVTDNIASATIRADATPTEISCAELFFIRNLFKKEPGNYHFEISKEFSWIEKIGIQRRFYESIALRIAKKLRALDNNTNKTLKPDKSSKNLIEQPTETLSKDKQYVELFGLKHQDEVIIQGNYW